MKLRKQNRLLNIQIILIVCILLLPAQVLAQRVVDKNKGNHNNTKTGYMDGNLVETIYLNFGEIADWQNNQQGANGAWPKGSGHLYIDGVAIIVQAETQDPAGNIIHPLETNYYEFTRHDPATGVTWGWYALPGYDNPFNNTIARSDDETTWPLHWPDRLSDWDGVWNGFFGKGVKNADLETFFVFDDNEDRQYMMFNNFYSDNEDPDRGGLGMQVRTRGFQWSQVLAEDAIFWFYEITNMSTTDYEKTLFAQYIDWGIGGRANSSNNAGDYDELNDISYAWCYNCAGGDPGGWLPIGYSAYAFLESPGLQDDHSDNDRDGLTDEKRDNEPNVFISDPNFDPFLLNPFQDTLRFKEFYNYSWKPHWDADENANWDPFLDIDESGEWEEGEPLRNDVGTDGIGPFDDEYEGPDEDGTQANGRPDQGEPNFGILDKDESDQLGLTGFQIFAVHTYELHNDEQNWEVLSSLPAPHGQSLIGVNLANYFSSYIFHLFGRNTYSTILGSPQETGETERFSMGLIFGIDKDDIFRRKKTVQQIYNANYHFAKPPDKPIIKVIPGDRKVTLYWGNRSELSFDAFYQKFNFEGYKIYRSTEFAFLENKIITDAYGKSTFRKPIVEFDLNDGITGLHPIDVNGAKYNLGDDSGLKHSFVDTTVQNGQTYYYAVVAYDQGFTTITIEGNLEGISPAENTSIIKIDINGDITTDINTAVVTPRAPAAGFISPGINNFFGSGPGTGKVSVTILDSVRNFHTYRLEFEDSTKYHNNSHPYYSLIDYTEGDTLINLKQIQGADDQTRITDGFSIDIQSDLNVGIDGDKSEWKEGNSNYVIQVGFDSRFNAAYSGKRVDYPADFEILFTAPGQGDTSFIAGTFFQPIPSNVVVKNITEDIDHFQFIFRDVNQNELFDVHPDSAKGDAIFIVFGDSAGKPAETWSEARISWSMTLVRDTTIVGQMPPQEGDVYKIITEKPFRTGEYFEFITQGQDFDLSKAQSEMNKIAVVPNPYTGAASWEPLSNTVGRGERRIFFIHLPNECTIRIYSLSGKLVQTIEHNSTISDGQESWNLVSKDGMDIAYGIYVFHVDAPGIGEKLGRFAIIK